jgi:mRNA interferase MazF
MKIEKYHIYLADLNPRFGTEPGKIRPVVVVQTDVLNQVHPSTVILPITTNVIQESSLLRVHLSKKDTNQERDSDVIIDQIRAIDKRRIVKHIGELKEEYRREIEKNLEILLFD